MAASRGRHNAENGLGELSEQFREPIEMLRQELAVLGEKIEKLPSQQHEDKVQRHFRRFLPFYALATVWVLMMVLFPTVRDGQSADQLTGVGVRGGGGAQGFAPGDFSSADGFDTGDVAGSTQDVAGRPITVGGQPGAAAGQSATSGGQTVRGTQQQVAGVVTGAGVTRGGFDCAPGVRQLPWSAYAAGCVAKFDGANGGATSRGVHPDKIVVATRRFPDSANSQATRAFAEAAGSASQDVAQEVRDTFRNYFNEVYELYGRKVEFVEFQASSQSNSTDEAQSKGKEGACIDATTAEKEVKAFGVTGSSGPFSECLAERKVITFGGGAYFPESWYRKYHPYIYNGVMGCERISYQVAEYVGKRLAKKPAKHAGDPLLQQQTREFGTYVPNNDEYQHCVNIYEGELETKYGQKTKSRYNYTLDVSRFPDEAARGIVQFKAAGVTTVVNACDPISTTVMTSAATGQRYFPEWLLIGVAAQDVDSVARLYDADQRDKNSIFGMSQLGDQSKIWGPAGEPGITYKKITGKDIPDGTDGGYFGLVALFNFLQAAGPNLTPETMERGVHAIMPGGPPEFAVGYISYQDGPDGTPGATDHTGIDDSREIYWCDTCASKIDGKEGAYLETYGGKRFRNGQWPAEDPPVYPPGFENSNP